LITSFPAFAGMTDHFPNRFNLTETESNDCQRRLQAYGLPPSMSGKGNCYDNASVDTFFKSLKAELIWRQKWPKRRQAEAAIFQYINGFYNTRRRHLYLGGISPLAFEAKVA
jgi:putative transposase